MHPRSLALVLLGVLSGMIAWLVTTAWLRHRAAERCATPIVQRVLEQRLDPMRVERASIEGVVVDRGGEPLARARVCANARTARVLAYDPLPRCALADDRGRFAIDALLAGDYRVVAMAEAQRPAEVEIELAPNDRKRDVELVLAPGGAPLAGVVVDLDGNPIRGAVVHAGAAVETDANGAFVLWVEPGHTAVRVSARGFATIDVTNPQRVVLAPESTIEGIAIDATTRAPIAGADVVVADRHALADSDGRFVIGGLARGRYVAMVTTAERYGVSAGAIAVGIGEAAQRMIVPLHPAHRVSGRVTIEERSCTGAHVALEASDVARRYEAWRGDDGTLQLDGVLPGEYQAIVECPGTTPRRYADVVVTERGDTREHEWIVDRDRDREKPMPPAEPAPVEGESDPITRTISGYVLDSENRPIDGALVIATRESDAREELAARAADTGAFELEVPTGYYTLRALRVGGGEGIVEHVEAGSRTSLTITPLGGVAGRTHVGGRAPSELLVIVNGARGEVVRERFFRTDGQWSVHGLVEGRYEIVLQAGDREHALSVTLAPGERRSGIDVELAAPRQNRRTWQQRAIASK